jgi:hypothetical protein
MIVWGGYNGSALGDGGAYDPIYDNWIYLPSTMNVAPAARYNHTMVWTGTLSNGGDGVVIIWGGTSTGSNALNTGAQFDGNPKSAAYDTFIDLSANHSGNSGTDTSTLSESAYSHTAVWTGARMVVFGGNGGSGAQNVGSQYEPVGDTWISTSTTNSVSARYNHFAFWTGEVVIYYGGTTGSAFASGGGFYYPYADSWAATTTNGTNEPVVDYPAVVWDDSHLIVWGGYTSGTTTPVATGATYDIVANAWTPMTSTGAPSARVFHSAVWTGIVAVVFGGQNSVGTVLNDVYVYQP